MTHFADPALLAALLLLAAIIGGYAAVFCRAPRVVGFLLAGLALHAILRAFAGEDSDAAHTFSVAAERLQGIKTLALGLIMFTIGSVFEVGHLKSVGRRVFRISLVKNACVFVLVGGGCTLACVFSRSVGLTQAAAFGILLAVAAIATAPAATLLVLREYEAKGPVSDTILTLTAINNTVCIVLFHAAFLVLSAAGVIEGDYGAGRWLALDLLLTSVGSVALGVALGFVFSILHAKVTLADFSLVFLGVVLGLGAFRDALSDTLHLSYNFLLTALFMGATFANITVDAEPFQKALRSFSAPIFALFFVLAGYDLHIDDLPKIGLLGLAYTTLRVAAKCIGGWLGARWSHAPGDVPGFVGFGMLCQAGVAIGLAEFLSNAWGTNGADGFVPNSAAVDFKTIILGSVVIFELIGPLALKAIAVRSGEVKAVTLMRRRAVTATRESVFILAWQSLLRTLGLASSRTRPDETLLVRHIMRSSIKVMPASSRFDEVLHFVEGSRFNHFPVVDEDERYVGMIHFSDLREMMYDPTVRDLVTAHDLARQNTPLAATGMTLQELLDVFHETDVGSLAVVDDIEARHVVGIVEQRDLLLALHKSQTS